MKKVITYLESRKQEINLAFSKLPVNVDEHVAETATELEEELRQIDRALLALGNAINWVNDYDWKSEQKKDFCRNRKCPFYDGWNHGCKQRSDARNCSVRQFY